jgi:hypothetical protein
MTGQPDKNSMPLIVTIVDTLGEKQDARSLGDMIVSAAVHGWMEGHLAAPGHRLDTGNVGEMPESPFPPTDNPQLKTTIQDAYERFEVGEESAAVAYAAALGWQMGRQSGMNCPGCAPKGGFDNPVVEAMRSGRASVRFHIEGPEDS